MPAPPGAWQRAALVAVPLALVVLIFVTPGLMGGEQPQATDLPFFLVRVTGHPWNESTNETAILYVGGALAATLYGYLELSATEDSNATYRANDSNAFSLSLKVPVVDGWVANVSALAVKEESRFRYNATVEFEWRAAGWTLLVQPEDASSPRESLTDFRAIMRREVGP